VGEFPVTSLSLPFGHNAVFAATVISMLQGISGYKDKALQNIRSNFAGVTVNEPDMMEMYQTQIFLSLLDMVTIKHE